MWARVSPTLYVDMAPPAPLPWPPVGAKSPAGEPPAPGAPAPAGAILGAGCRMQY